MLKLTKGKDDVVQGTDVQVFIHKLGRGIITRPYQNFYPKDISSKENAVDKNSEDSHTNISSKEEPRVTLVLDLLSTDLIGSKTKRRTMER